MVPRARAHLGQPGVELVQAVDSNHVVDVSQLLEVLAQRVHRFGQVRRLLLYLLRRLDDLLIEDLIAVGKVSHAGAEDHGVLIHVDPNAALLGYKLRDRLAVLCLLEDFVRFDEFFVVFDLQEVDQADGGLELLAASDCLQETLELLLSFRQELLRHLVGFEGQRRNQDMRELSFQNAAQVVKVCVFAAYLPP